MKMNRRSAETSMSMPAGIGIGGIWSLAITILLSAITAKLIEMETVSQKNAGFFVIVILLASSITGALQAFRKIKARRMMVCLISGLVYFCVLLSMTALLFEGQYQGVGVTGLVILCGSCCAGLMGLHEKKHSRRGKMALNYR